MSTAPFAGNWLITLLVVVVVIVIIVLLIKFVFYALGIAPIAYNIQEQQPEQQLIQSFKILLVN